MKPLKDQKVVAYVEATIRMPLYEEDDVPHITTSDNYVYEEWGCSDGRWITRRRECKLVAAKIIEA